MKKRNLFVSFLIVLLLLTSCTTPTPTPTLTPTPTPEIEQSAIWGKPTKSEMDYIKQIASNTWPPVKGWSGVLGNIDPQLLCWSVTKGDVDVTKLEKGLIETIVSTPDSQGTVKGIMHKGKYNSDKYCPIEILLLFDCEKDNMFPTSVDIVGFEDGVLEIVAYYVKELTPEITIKNALMYILLDNMDQNPGAMDIVGPMLNATSMSVKYTVIEKLYPEIED